MTLRLKIVPNSNPDADGEWIEMKPMGVVNTMLYNGLGSREKWDLYDAQAPIGFHVVAVDGGVE